MVADLLGQTFGMLTIIGAVRGTERRLWKGRCVCGTEKLYTTGHLRGSTKSCGCSKSAIMKEVRARHGDNRGGQRTKEYRTWAHIRGRCNNPSDAAYRLYGARGVRVCQRWSNSFEEFLADMGRAPSPRHSIDRLDTNGNYEPKNCRWATPAEQSRNTRRNIMVDGLCLRDACHARGVSYGAAQLRLRRGEGLEAALSPLSGRAWRRAFPRPAMLSAGDLLGERGS